MLQKSKQIVLFTMSAKLTTAQEQELMHVFVMMDKNGSGGVEIRELNYLMCKLLGQEVDELTLSEILSELTDSDAPGRFISFHTFKEYMGPIIANINVDDMCNRAFKALDKDGSGSISVSELRPILSATAGSKLSEAQVDSVLKVAAGSDGTVRLKDYMAVIKSDLPTVHKEGYL